MCLACLPLQQAADQSLQAAVAGQAGVHMCSENVIMVVV